MADKVVPEKTTTAPVFEGAERTGTIVDKSGVGTATIKDIQGLNTAGKDAGAAAQTMILTDGGKTVASGGADQPPVKPADGKPTPSGQDGTRGDGKPTPSGQEGAKGSNDRTTAPTDSTGKAGGDKGGRPVLTPDGSWQGFPRNDTIEQAAPADRQWNPATNPVPPLGQIVARDSGNDPTVVKAVTDAMTAQSGGDKRQLGALIVEQATKAGMSAGDAQKMVDKALGEQKNMQYDYAGNEMAKMITADGNGNGGKTLAQVKAENPALADRIDKTAEAMVADQGLSPFAMQKNLDVQKELWKTFDPKSTDSPEGKEALRKAKLDPDEVSGVEAKATDLSDPKKYSPAERAAKIKEIGQGLRDFYLDGGN